MDEIDETIGQVEELLIKHKHWHPVDRETMHSWKKYLGRMKNKAEFMKHPVAKEVVSYLKMSIREINEVLLSKYSLKEQERQNLLDKRDMYVGMLRIFDINKEAVAQLKREVRDNLSTQSDRGKEGEYTIMKSSRNRYAKEI